MNILETRIIINLILKKLKLLPIEHKNYTLLTWDLNLIFIDPLPWWSYGDHEVDGFNIYNFIHSQIKKLLGLQFFWTYYLTGKKL